ncbi:MAG: sigma-70 family RNA polymerase sigma factor [Planctomycetota bacterium]
MSHAATPSPAPRDLALESALVEHGPFLRRLACALVRDEHAADDLVQDTWAAALRQPGTAARSRAWLATVLSRRAISQRRRDGAADPAAVARERADAAPAADDVAVTLERERVLHDAIEGLDEPYRTAVFLRYHEELPPRAIAKRLGVPVKTIDTRLARGRALLREDLDRRFGGEDDSRSAWMAALAPLASPEFAATGAAVSSPAFLGGLFAVKLVAAASVVALVVWFLSPNGGSSEPVQPAPDLATVASAAAGPVEPSAATSAPALAAAAPAATVREGVVAPTVSAATQGASVTVVVTDEAGTPIVNRTVLLAGPNGLGRRSDSIRRRTNTEGRTAFEGLAPGRYSVYDARDAKLEWIELAADQALVLEWRLDDQLTIRGRVTLADGSPAGDATIWIGPTKGSAPLLLPLSRADAGGNYVITASNRAHIQASLPGHLPSQMFFASDVPEVEPGVRAIDLVLGPAGRTISGQVVDTSGAPIEGASVVAGPRGGYGQRSKGYAPHPVTVTTDADGRFEYGQALPDGDQTIAAFAPGFAARREVLAAGGPNVVELVLGGGADVRGVVLRPDGTPAAKAVVRIVDPNDRPLRPSLVPSHTITADSDGRFSLALVGPGAQRVHARSDHREPLARASEDVAIVAGETYDLTLRLSDEPAIAGRVVDRDGLGVEGVRIRAQESLMRTSHGTSVKTAADGSFRLTCLEEIQYGPQLWRIEAFVIEGRAMQVFGSKDDIAPGTDDVLLTIDRPVTASAYLEGRFVPEPGETRIPADTSFTLWREDTNMGSTLTYEEDTGRFRVGPLLPGAHRVTGRRQDTVVLCRSGLMVQAGETVDVGDLVMGTGGRVEITGSLEDDLGAPASAIEQLLGGIQVTITHRGRTVWLDREDGRWVSNELVEPGTWELRGDGERTVFPFVSIDVTDGETTTRDVVLRVGQNPRIVVTMPDPETWSRARVTATDSAGTLVAETEWQEQSGLEDPTTATFRPTIPFGEVTLTVETDTDVGATKSLTVPDLRTEFLQLVEIDAR